MGVMHESDDAYSVAHTSHNDVITKIIEKRGHPRNQSTYISFETSRRELSKNVSFIKFEQFCQKLWAFK